MLPEQYEIRDFSKPYNPEQKSILPYSIGKYNEQRVGMYTAAIFKTAEEERNIHLGIDIGAPINTPIHAFYEGEIFMSAYNGAKGDYGYTIITKHLLGNTPLYALHGHLSETSVKKKQVREKIQKGEVIAWVGDKHENGGWNPHLHFQLSWEEPKTCDMPGVANKTQLDDCLKIYPDPRIVLGPLY